MPWSYKVTAFHSSNDLSPTSLEIQKCQKGLIKTKWEKNRKQTAVR